MATTSYTLKDLESDLRAGPYAWPGGYFIARDGEPLSFDAVKGNWREVCSAMLHPGSAKDWEVVASKINWFYADLYCAHTNERIPSVYAEPEGND